MLPVPTCPHCGTARPALEAKQHFDATVGTTGLVKHWTVYACRSCAGAVSAYTTDKDHHNRKASNSGGIVAGYYPEPTEFVPDPAIPDRAAHYLSQAVATKDNPSASVMVAASAVDAMLKVLGYKDGVLHSRIEKAHKDGKITADMAAWAHEIRFGANEQRHADEAAPLPTSEDAHQLIEFAQAFAQLLFVLPARVKRNREAATRQAANIAAALGKS